MKNDGTAGRYISGPHARDYYLLQDEQSEHIFTTRLAEHTREASGITTASLLEMWIDDARQVWYLFVTG